MQIVIDIPDEEYKRLVYIDMFKLKGYIENGTPLPKGHGDLVDYEELKNNAREYGAYTEAALSHVKPKTIIEADTEEENADSN